MKVSTYRVGIWVISLYASTEGNRYCVRCEPTEFASIPRRLSMEFFSSRRDDAESLCREYRQRVELEYRARRSAGM